MIPNFKLSLSPTIFQVGQSPLYLCPKIKFNICKIQETLNITRTRTQQDIQTPSHFVSEEIVETIPTTTQQNISPIHPTLTTPQNRNTLFQQTTLASIVKPSVVPKYYHMDYQTASTTKYFPNSPDTHKTTE